LSRKLNLIGPLRIEVIGGVTLLLVSLLVRLHHLSFDSLFMDELRQVRYYANDFGDLLADAAGMHQSPLDLWIGKIFFFFSDSDFSARLPAALFGTGSVLVFYALSVRLANVRIALFFTRCATLFDSCIFLFTTGLCFSLGATKSANRCSRVCCNLFVELVLYDG
jgi:predicted membrane-bound mannosyltransferase